jgi:hypothetical protein
MARVCRRCFLFGDDPLTCKNFDLRLSVSGKPEILFRFPPGSQLLLSEKLALDDDFVDHLDAARGRTNGLLR